MQRLPDAGPRARFGSFIRPLNRDVGNQALLQGPLLEWSRHSADIDNQAVDLNHPREWIISEPAGQGPFGRHGSHLEKIANFLGLALPGAFADPKEFMDRFGPAVWHLGRIIERIDATDSSTEAVAQTFFCTSPKARILFWPGANNLMDHLATFGVQALCTEPSVALVMVAIFSALALGIFSNTMTVALCRVDIFRDHPVETTLSALTLLLSGIARPDRPNLGGCYSAANLIWSLVAIGQDLTFDFCHQSGHSLRPQWSQ